MINRRDAQRYVNDITEYMMMHTVPAVIECASLAEHYMRIRIKPCDEEAEPIELLLNKTAVQRVTAEDIACYVKTKLILEHSKRQVKRDVPKGTR